MHQFPDTGYQCSITQVGIFALQMPVGVNRVRQGFLALRGQGDVGRREGGSKSRYVELIDQVHQRLAGTPGTIEYFLVAIQGRQCIQYCLHQGAVAAAKSVNGLLDVAHPIDFARQLRQFQE